MRARWIIWISLVLAVSVPALAETKSGLTVSSGVTTLQANWLNSGNSTLQRMLYFGAGFALYSHYIHFDVDGYFGSAGIKGQNNNDGSLDQFGGLASVGVHLPIYAGQGLIQPKFGVGYGLMSLSYGGSIAPTARISAPVGSKQLLHGGFLVPGLAIEPWPWMILEADYAFSVFSASERTGSLTGFALNLPNGGSGFERIRAGVSFRVGKGILLGLQFVQRTSHYGVFGNTGDITPIQQHFLGTLGLEF